MYTYNFMYNFTYIFFYVMCNKKYTDNNRENLCTKYSPQPTLGCRYF
jgi:hypothetical protein